MLPSQAKRLLGFPTNSTPSPSEVKEAYKKMAWDCHPDRFPESEKVISEARFKLVLEAYTCLKTGPNTGAASYSYVHYGRGCTCKGFGHTNSILVMMPFALIVLGTLSFGGFRAVKLYKEQRQTYPSSNPFLP